MSDPRELFWAEACALLERAERLQRQFFRPSLPDQAGWEPPVDLYETERELCLIVALPGVDEEDLKVAIAAGELVVAGLRRFPILDPDAIIHRLEIPHGKFERRVRLPAGRFRLSRSALVAGCLLVTLSKEL